MLENPLSLSDYEAPFPQGELLFPLAGLLVLALLSAFFINIMAKRREKEAVADGTTRFFLGRLLTLAMTLTLRIQSLGWREQFLYLRL
jgi:hypothetical protein